MRSEEPNTDWYASCIPQVLLGGSLMHKAMNMNRKTASVLRTDEQGGPFLSIYLPPRCR
jgi:hypothetical protein